MRVNRVVLIVLVVLAGSRVADAQTTSAPLARFVSDLIAAGARMDSVAAVEVGDFLIAQQLGGLPSQLNQSLGFQMATFPFDMGLSTSKPGYDSVPTNYGFGPSFSVRAGGVGRGKVSVSFNYQNVSFGWIDGIPLRDSQLGFVLRSPASTQANFGRDVMHQSLALRMQQSVATFGIVYGASDRLDIGVGVPMMHVEMEGQLLARVFGPVFSLPSRPPCVPTDRFCNPGIPVDAHFFDVYPSSPPVQADGCKSSAIDIQGVDHAPGQIALFDMVELASRTITRKCKASGIGDIVGHVGYRLTDSETNGLAVTVDARLPTGDADNLLGSGGTRVTGGVSWRGRSGRFLPHVAAGYTLGIGEGSALFNSVTSCTSANVAPPATRVTTCSTNTAPTPLDLKLPAELSVAGGTDMVFYRRLTVGADMFVRRVENLTKFQVNPTTAPALQPGDPAVPGNLLQVKGTGAMLMVAVASAQVALTDRTLIKTNMLIPMAGKGDGLSTRMSFGFGLGVRY